MIWFTFRVLVDLHLLRDRAARQNKTAERGSQVRRVQVDSRISYILLRDWRICRKENYNLGSLKKKKKKVRDDWCLLFHNKRQHPSIDRPLTLTLYLECSKCLKKPTHILKLNISHSTNRDQSARDNQQTLAQAASWKLLFIPKFCFPASFFIAAAANEHKEHTSHQHHFQSVPPNLRCSVFIFCLVQLTWTGCWTWGCRLLIVVSLRWDGDKKKALC